jgi:hypothetical protein
VRRLDQWTTAPDTTAREYVLPGGGRIVGGRTLGPHLLVWTTHALFLGVFTGSPGQPWRFDRVGQACGLIGPNAATVSGQTAFWLGPDLQVWRYALGGAPEPLSCDLSFTIIYKRCPFSRVQTVCTTGAGCDDRAACSAPATTCSP